MRAALVDSDIVIDYLRGLEASRGFFLSTFGSRELYVSVITLAEVYSGRETKDMRRLAVIEEFLSNFEVTPVTPSIAKRAGQLRRDRTRPFADMLIAATAIEYGFDLATRNIKHFSDVPSLKVVKPY